MERISLFSKCGRMMLAHHASTRTHPSLSSSHKGVPRHLFLGELLPRYFRVSPSYLHEGKGTGEDAALGQPIHSFGSSKALEQAASRYDSGESYNGSASHSQDIPTDSHVDAYDHGGRINLHACMQSQVPEPYGRTPTHMNMPGGVSKREDKYIQGMISELADKREYSTSSSHSYDEHGNLSYLAAKDILQSPCPQGIQGDDCEQFKLWLSNCLRTTNDADCERLANEYIAGRKSLAQVFAEYELQIRHVVTAGQRGSGQPGQ